MDNVEIHSTDDFYTVIESKSVGDNVKLKIIRQGSDEKAEILYETIVLEERI